MIKASDILEALARFDDPVERAKMIYKILDPLGASQNKFFDSNQFLYLKRLIPESSYAGPGYRFIGLDHQDAARFGIYDNETDAYTQETPNKSQLINYFRNHQRGRYQSWAKSLNGINAEMGKQDFDDLIHGEGNFYIFTAHVSGIDLTKCAEDLLAIIKTLSSEDQKSHRLSTERIEYIIKDHASSEEILAPMPSKVDFYGVFNADDLKYVRDVRKIRTTGATVHDVDLESELIDALKKGRMRKTNDLLELGIDCDDILRRALEGDAGYELFQDIIYSGHNIITGDCGGGDTPLMVAVKEIDMALMEYLNYSKRQIDEQNDQGETALWLAVDHRFHEGVEFLLKEKADPNISPHKGKTPLGLAKELKEPEIVDMLIRVGAKE